MKNKLWITNLLIIVIALVAVVIGYIYFKPSLFNKKSSLSTSMEHEEDFIRGPHKGRLLQKDDFQAEVTIFEPEGIPPKFRIYFYDNKVPVNPSEVKYEMELKRINRVENIPFKPENNYLESTVEAKEPHSFKVKIKATFKDQLYEWEYDSFEGRVELSPESISANAIQTEKARSINLKVTLDVMGKITPNEELTVFISPRFPGMVKAVNKKLGDYVRKGDVLAIIESNESLKNYEIRSEINGRVIKRDINLGMYLSGQENIFVITDLSSVWADFNIYRQDLPQVKVGDPIHITNLNKSLNQQSTISYISPIGNENTQSVIARAILTNPNESWKPSLFISGEITVDNVAIPVAVKHGALQTFRDVDVVFISMDNVFEAVPVKLGRHNKEWIEIISGLSEGDRYVSENSFILKADLEKSGAAHEH